jgi:hypothetical protein
MFVTSLDINATYEALFMASFNVAKTWLWCNMPSPSRQSHSNISLNFSSISKNKKELWSSRN